LNKLVRPIFVVNLQLFSNLSGFGSLRQRAAPAASVVADSTIEACPWTDQLFASSKCGFVRQFDSNNDGSSFGFFD
jgi:hypothetical protein